MIIKKGFVVIGFLFISLVFSQQNEAFIQTKKYFDHQKFLVLQQFQKEFNQEKDEMKRQKMNTNFVDFIKRIDSVQNEAYIQTLVRVKNIEDLERDKKKQSLPIVKNANSIVKDAEYPGGFTQLRKQLAELVYTENISSAEENIRASIKFIVDSDGSIYNVKVEGENPTFNKQVTIAMYLLPDKFTPEIIDGVPVKSHFRIPIMLSL